MNVNWKCRCLFSATIALSGVFVATSQEVCAQRSCEGISCLVVVADGSDAECVKQIGGEHVAVEQLFTDRHGASLGDYEASNIHVSRLRRFNLYFARDGAYCPRECFWRERLTRFNPHGRVHWIARARCATEDGYGRWSQRATEVHRALVAVLPERRSELDANLRLELERYQSFATRTVELASDE